MKYYPELADYDDYRRYYEGLEAEVIALESLSSVHIRWYTHKNPYGCWICDMHKLLYHMLKQIDSISLLIPSPIRLNDNLMLKTSDNVIKSSADDECGGCTS